MLIELIFDVSVMSDDNQTTYFRQVRWILQRHEKLINRKETKL